MAVTKEEIEQARQDAKQEKNQRRMEREVSRSKSSNEEPTESEKLEKYRDEPGYFGYEDDTPEGRKAIAAYNKAAKKAEYKDQTVPTRSGMNASKSGVRAAQSVIKEHREKMKPFERVDAMGNAYKKGGSVKSASSRADGCACRGKTRGKMV